MNAPYPEPRAPSPRNNREAASGFLLAPRPSPLAPRFAKPQAAGFTLVELLTVVLIIGVLAGLITAAAVPAIRKGKETTIRNEIAQLEQALTQYKEQFGDYPPDFAGINDPDQAVRNAARNDVLAHLRRAFPRYRPGVPSGTAQTDPFERFRDDVFVGSGNTLDVCALEPGSALVFWLGGLPTPPGTGSTKLCGFCADPANPFTTQGSRLAAVIELDERRLVAGPTTNPTPPIPWKSVVNPPTPSGAQVPYVYRFVPQHVSHPESDTPPPYVYFRARSGGYVRNIPGTVSAGSGYQLAEIHVPGNPRSFLPSFTLDDAVGTAVPYVSEFVPQSGAFGCRFLNPKTFQIVTTGLDGEYGAVLPPTDSAFKPHCVDPTTGNLASSEDDNLTNFATGHIADGVQ